MGLLHRGFLEGGEQKGAESQYEGAGGVQHAPPPHL